MPVINTDRKQNLLYPESCSTKKDQNQIRDLLKINFHGLLCSNNQTFTEIYNMAEMVVPS